MFKFSFFRSSNCVQKLGYDCKRSRLLNTPIGDSDSFAPYGWWVSRQNRMMDYWAGSLPGMFQKKKNVKRTSSFLSVTSFLVRPYNAVTNLRQLCAAMMSWVGRWFDNELLRPGSTADSLEQCCCKKRQKKVQGKKLVWGIGVVWRFWMIPNWS